jgi:RNA polymerase sigma factor (sigma-70 family)
VLQQHFPDEPKILSCEPASAGSIVVKLRTETPHMAQTTLSDVVHYLRKVCALEASRDLADGELLGRFVAARDEAAFSALVRRHGPAVLGVCRRVLGDEHGAEDAFQAVFLVLVRRAASLRRNEPVGGWLYAVAQRVAMKARRQTRAQRQRERRTVDMPRSEPVDDLAWQELRSVLDEEIAKLPEKYRTPLVLCYFEGMSHAKAAKEMGCPTTSLTSRVERGRELLRQRLVRRGITLSAGALAAILSEKAGGTVLGAMLAINTVKAAMSVAAGKTVAGGCLSATAISLAEEAISAMTATKAMLVFMVVAMGLAVGGAGLAAVGEWKGQSPPTKAEPPRPVLIGKQPAVEKKGPDASVDLYGDPLPEGVVARLGTLRFRHDFQVCHVEFAADGKTLVSGGGTGIGIAIWDAATGRPLRRFSNPSLCNNFALSPDGKLLFTDDLRLIEVATGKAVRRLKAPGGGRSVGFVAFSPDGKTLAAVESLGGSNIVLWDADEANGSRNLDGHTADVRSVAFSPDGKTLASASEDKTVRLWNVASGKEIRRFEGNEKPVHSVAFAPGGKILAAAGEDGVIRLWDAETGKIAQQLKGDQKGTRRIVNTIAFSPDGNLLASGGVAWPQEGISLWDLATGKEPRLCEPHNYWISSLAFSPNGKVLASVGGTDSTVHLWDSANGKEIDLARGHTGSVRSLRFSLGGHTLYSTSWFDVKEWDIASGRQRQGLFAGPRESVPGSPLIPEGGVLSPDAKVLALVGRLAWQNKYDSDIHLLDTRTGKEVRTLKGHRDELSALAYSPDGKLLASGAKDGIRLWDLETSQELHYFSNDQTWGAFLVFSPDGKLLASGGSDSTTLWLWDTATGKEIRRWDSQQRYMRDLAFSPDGRVLASASERFGAGVRIWSTANGKELLRFGRIGEGKEEGGPELVAFSPTGRILATAGVEARRLTKDGDYELASKVHLWDVGSGKEIRQFEVPQGTIFSLRFAPDGRTLATGGGDSTILLWDVTGHAGKPKSAPLTPAQLDDLWLDLNADAAKADRAIWSLAFSPQQSVPFLKERLRPIAPAPAPAEQVAKLMAELDDQRFAVRQKAAQALLDLHDTAEAAIRKSLAANPPLEVRQRLEQILEKGDKEAIRKLRAVEALEQAGTAEARQLLQSLANEAPNPRVMDAAQAGLARLGKR